MARPIRAGAPGKKVHIGIHVEKDLWEDFRELARRRQVSATNGILRLVTSAVTNERIPGLEPLSR